MSAERTRKIKEAQAFLLEALGHGPRPARDVEAEALAQGISHTTLATARGRLHIASTRQGNQWIWSPPTRARARGKSS